MSVGAISNVGQKFGVNSSENTKKDNAISIPQQKNDSFEIQSIKKLSENYFDKCSAKNLPKGVAIQISTRTTWPWKIANAFGFICSLGGALPIWFFKTDNETVLSLVKIDENDLTKKQKKLIRDGKLINYIPQGYEINNGKVIKIEE